MSQFVVQNAVPDLEENVGATEITLTEHELNRLEAVAPKNVAAGERYPRISHKLEGQRGRGGKNLYKNSPLLPCTSAGFERCGEKSGYPDMSTANR
ncbi:hypothetical protein [uncultured Nostoc sp.]|uniref:hypothetical protein n=1 Tax=uncultured Nostoc sp. TaxID=340711 RepID=UPI0035CC3336